MMPATIALRAPVVEPDCVVCEGWRVVWLVPAGRLGPWLVRCLACCHGVVVGLPMRSER